MDGRFYLARAALRARRAPTLKGGGSGGNGDQDSPRAYIYLTPVSKSGWSGGAARIGTTRGRLFISHRYRKAGGRGGNEDRDNPWAFIYLTPVSPKPRYVGNGGRRIRCRHASSGGGHCADSRKTAGGVHKFHAASKTVGPPDLLPPPSFRNRAQAPSHSRPQLDHN